MRNPHFSFIILTLNEQLHLPRLLNSIKTLNASTYVLDSGSTDKTPDICYNFNVEFRVNAFYNHPTQWDTALRIFTIKTPWVICLDADQIVTPELCKLLGQFRDGDYLNSQGIYFNRKNYFKGSWIKYGGYYPKYLLKMFRYEKGYSDLTENMDHRFQVPGKTIIWKKGYLIEENLKENKISFWIEKHNRYSDLAAQEEISRKMSSSVSTIKAQITGTPNQKIAFLKNIWRNMPGYWRCIFYLFYRLFIRLGILDGKNGVIYHFLQGFWFRLIVDIKMDELSPSRKSNLTSRFLFHFLLLFCVFYGFNLFFIGAVSKGGLYIQILDQNLNYINYWRQLYISTSAWILDILGYSVHIFRMGLTVKYHSGFRLIYSCLGYGIISSFSAFVLAYPKPLRSRLIFLSFGSIGIQLLNILRLVLISIYYKEYRLNLDHHILYNFLLYATIVIAVKVWLNQPVKTCKIKS